ncbi:MAG: phage terminase large subunit [Bryobacteraceae bacterium]
MTDYEELRARVTGALDKATPAERRTLLDGLAAVLSTASPAGWAQRASDQAFEVPPHVNLLDQAIVDLAECDSHAKLMITMPPRHGKSELASRYTPPWYLSRWPGHRVMLCAYEADFAATWGRKARNLVQENPWCGIKVNARSTAAKRWDVAGHSGGMVTAGVGGPITGKGANLLIIDDPVKNAEQAQSQTFRDRAWEWYQQTAFTRLEPNGKVLAIMTRWHEDDLFGRLLDREPDSWRVINLPALAEEHDLLRRKVGDALWPARYDANALASIRTTIGMRAFTALYQQRPSPIEGSLFHVPSLRYWDFKDRTHYDLGGEIIDRRAMVVFSTADLAVSTSQTADYTVIATWAITRADPAQLMLLDLERGRIEGADHLDLVRKVVDKHHPDWVGVESRTFGISLLQVARRSGLRMRDLSADKDKVTRALPAAVLCETGRVWLPNHHPLLGEIEHELSNFPYGAHDDIVDCLAYAARHLNSRTRWTTHVRSPEPKTTDERIWDQVARSKRRTDRMHPVLGRII